MTRPQGRPPGFKMSEESKAKIRAAAVAMWDDPEFMARQRAVRCFSQGKAVIRRRQRCMGVLLPEDLYQRLYAHSKSTKCSMAELVRRFAEWGLDTENAQELPE